MDANDQLHIVVVDPAAKHDEVAIKFECDASRVAVIRVEFGWPSKLLMGGQRFCSAFEELRRYLRIRPHPGERVSLSERRHVFEVRWRNLMAEMAAA